MFRSNQLLCGLMLAAAFQPQAIAAEHVAERAAEAPSKRCAGADFHALDFQVGAWQLTDNVGQPAGVIHNTAILGGCAIAEDYFDATNGMHGVSTSAWDPTTKSLKQYWVANTGSTLLIEGHRAGDRVVMHGVLLDKTTGKPQQQRLTWFVGKDGKVARQLWEQSDDGAHWKSGFDATYTPLL
ncbi:MAG: hypothetical protein ABJA62_01870 [Luteimonas sp.]